LSLRKYLNTHLVMAVDFWYDDMVTGLAVIGPMPWPADDTG
jgi:hypothetical protein